MDTWIERARERLRSSDLTYDDIREALGVSTRGAVGHYFAGRRQLSAAQAVSLARRLGCSVEWLLTGKPAEPEPSSGEIPYPSPTELLHRLQALPQDAYGAVVKLVDVLAGLSR